MPKTITVTFQLEGDASGADIAQFLDIMVCDDNPPFHLSCPVVFMDTPCVVVEVKQGMVCSMTAEIPLVATVLDYDLEEAQAELPNKEGDGNIYAVVENPEVHVDPEWIGRLAAVQL